MKVAFLFKKNVVDCLVGLESTLSHPNEKQKESYKENAENIFVLREYNKIVAATILDDNEIDGVMFSFVLRFNLKYLISMLSSNFKSLDFELKALVIMSNKNIRILDIIRIFCRKDMFRVLYLKSKRN